MTVTLIEAVGVGVEILVGVGTFVVVGVGVGVDVGVDVGNTDVGTGVEVGSAAVKATIKVFDSPEKFLLFPENRRSLSS